MSALVLGRDGGGTKTLAAIADTDGLVRDARVLDLARSGDDACDWPVVEGPGLVAPALVDAHTLRYGGVKVADCTLDHLDEALAGLHRAGVGGLLLGLATMPPERLVTQMIERLAPMVGRTQTDRATVLGLHLEGPYPSVARQIEATGARVALGHSKATMVEALDDVARGARHVTHLWNGMSGVAHREAGPAPVAPAALTVEVIADGIHIDPAIIDLTYRLTGAERLCLIIDAMAATAVADGVYESAGACTTVAGSIARTEEGALACSTLTMAQAAEDIVRWGIAPLAIAVGMAASSPARALGLEPRGTLQPGAPARLVSLSSEGRLLPWPDRAALEEIATRGADA